MSNNKNLLSGFWKVLDKNAPTIATFGSVIGIGLTIYFSHKAAKRAAEEQKKYEEALQAIEKDIQDQKLNDEEAKEEKTRAKFNHIATNVLIYRWAILSGLSSGGLAVLANWLNGRTIFGLTTLAVASSDKLKIGLEKVKEMIGEEKFNELKASIDKEFIGQRAKDEKAKIEVSRIKAADDLDDGEVEYWDTYIGQPLAINPHVLEDAISRAENLGTLDWATWRGYLGLYGPAMIGYDVAWNLENRFKAHSGYIDLGGDIGMKKAIIYDVVPSINRCSK